MAMYHITNGDRTYIFNSDTLPIIEKNTAGDHLLKIAMAFEKAGIEGVHVEFLEAGTKQEVCLLYTSFGSIGKAILDQLLVRLFETGLILPVDQALELAMYFQKQAQKEG